MAKNDPRLDRIRIGVLCGGDSPERAGSLVSGEHAAKGLSELGIAAQLIDIADTPVHTLAGEIDVALLALHGLTGEDGKVQGTLDVMGIPYSGSGVLASALGMHKATFKNLVNQERMDTPRSIRVNHKVSVASTVSSAKGSLGFPVFVKPSSGGGSLGAGIAHDADQLREMLEALDDSYSDYLIEEYVQGIACTVGMVEVDGQIKQLPVHQAETDREFYDYEAKHDPTLRREHCPSILPQWTTDNMQYMAKRIFTVIGAHGVLRVDFLAGSDGRVTMLEVNTVPGLSELGNLATMAKAGGIAYPTLMRHVLMTAFTKPAYVP